MLLVLVPVFLLASIINTRLVNFGRLGAEIHADNIATRLAYVLDRPLFDKLETITLPNDGRLNSKQEQTRRARFLSTITTYRKINLIDTRHDETLPPLSFYLLYAVFVYLAGRTMGWGKLFDDKIFDGWWILAGGAALLKLATYLYSLKIKRGVIEKVTGGNEELFVGAEQG